MKFSIKDSFSKCDQEILNRKLNFLNNFILYGSPEKAIADPAI